MKATTAHTTDLDVNIKKKPTPQTPPRAEAWYAVMGGVLFLILTLVLVVILAWVHWGTGMCFLNNGAGFVPRVPDAVSRAPQPCDQPPPARPRLSACNWRGSVGVGRALGGGEARLERQPDGVRLRLQRLPARDGAPLPARPGRVVVLLAAADLDAHHAHLRVGLVRDAPDLGVVDAVRGAVVQPRLLAQAPLVQRPAPRDPRALPPPPPPPDPHHVRRRRAIRRDSAQLSDRFAPAPGTRRCTTT